MPADDENYQFFPPQDDIKFFTDEGEPLPKEDISQKVEELKTRFEEQQALLLAAEAGLVSIEPAQPEEHVQRLEAVAEAQAPRKTYSPRLIRELRSYDIPKKNKTCSSCTRRRPLAELQDGKSDVCDDCRG